MRLQLRVRHSLGTRMLEVASRGPDHPVRVGRSADAEVRIPSSGVSDVHCLLYEQDGRWVVCEPEGAGTLTVNGEPIGEAAYVDSGDVIALADVATVEVDPLGLLRQTAAAAASARPSAPEVAQQPAEPEAAAPALPEEQPAAESAFAAEPQNDEDTESAGVGEYSGLAGGTSTFRRRRPSKNNTAVIGWVVGLAAAFIIAVIVVMVNYASRMETPPPAVVKAPPPEVPTQKKSNIFDDMTNTRPRATRTPAPRATADGSAAARPRPETPPTPEDGDNTQPKPKPAAVEGDEAWQDVEIAHDKAMNAPSGAIWSYIQYRKEHPGQRAEQIKEYLEEATDRQWWLRIEELCKKRATVDKDIDKRDKEIREEDDKQQKAEMERQRQTMLAARQAIVDALQQDMGYKDTAAPDPDNDQQIAALREKRDNTKYDAWCRKLLTNIEHYRRPQWQE